MSERSRRRCVLRKTALPDATHYVGYVEDEETPEMIMKKFEEMERIRAAASSKLIRKDAQTLSSTASEEAGPSSAADHEPAAAAAPEGGPLDQEQLHAVFKATSMYNIKSILSNNQALMTHAGKQQDRGHTPDIGNNSGSEDDLVAELRGFWSDDDWGRAKKPRSKGTKASSGSSKPEAKRRSKALQRNQVTSIITQYNRDTNAFIRRRVRAVDPDAIQQLRLPPPPLPLSWGRAIQPHRQRVQQQPTSTNVTAAAHATASEAQAAGSAAGQHIAPAAAAAALRGVIHQRHALPASRNCDPTGSLGPGQALPADACEVHTAPSIPSFAFSSLRVQQYQAVLINTGWEVRQPHQQQQQQQQPHHDDDAGAAAGSCNNSRGSKGVASWQQCGVPEHISSSSSGSSSSGLPGVVQRLAAVPIPQLCPRGFIMIWVNKEHLSAVVKVMSQWGFSYVENLTWVLLHPNHSILRLPYAYLQRSHITLYIFRKDGEGRDIELRHQRNPDVVFDCVRAVEGREWDVPAEVFGTIETLLPTGKGLFLELWAPTGAGRAGWTHIVEQQLQQ